MAEIIVYEALALVKLSQEEYVRLLMLQKDRQKRNRMKQIAFAAMYSGNPSAFVFMPYTLIKGLDDAHPNS